MKKHFLIIALLAAPFLVNAQVKINDKTFTVEIPTGWDTLHINGILAIFTPIDGPGDKFRENVNIIEEPIEPGAEPTLEMYLEYVLMSLEKDYKIPQTALEVKAMQLGKNKIEAKYVRYHTPSEANKNVELTVTQFLIKGKNAFYVITYTAKENTVSIYWDAVLKITNSFIPLN